MPRPSTVAFVGLFCASVLCHSSGFAQDLGSRTRRPMERGPIDVAQLTQRADLIVRGFVKSKEARWIGRVIYTHYDVVVQETLKGQARSSVLVAVVGGAMGNVALSVPGTPNLAIGEQLVFFGEGLADRVTFRPVATLDGIVQIRAGSGRSMASVAPRGRPEALEAFLQEVRQSEPPAMTRHKEKGTRRTSSGRLLTLCALLIALGVGSTGNMRAGDNLDFLNRRPDPRHVLGFAVVRRDTGFSGRHPLVPQPGRDARQLHPDSIRSPHRGKLQHVGGRGQRHSSGAACAGRELRRSNGGGRPVRARRFQRDRVAARASQAARWLSTPCWVLTEPTTTTADGGREHGDARCPAVRPSRFQDLPV